MRPLFWGLTFGGIFVAMGLGYSLLGLILWSLVGEREGFGFLIAGAICIIAAILAGTAAWLVARELEDDDTRENVRNANFKSQII